MVLAKCTVKKSPTDVIESMGRLAIIGYGYVSLFGSDSYSHTVELVYIEGLLCIAHCLHCDAVGSNTGVLKSLGHSCGTTLGYGHVVGRSTGILIGIACDGDFRFRISLHVLYQMCYLFSFALANLGRVDDEEHVFGNRFGLLYHRCRSRFWFGSRSGSGFRCGLFDHNFLVYCGDSALILSETDCDTYKTVVLPVEMAASFGIEIIGKHIGVGLYIYSHTRANPYVQTKTTTGCKSPAVITPQFLEAGTGIGQTHCLIVVEGIISAYAKETVEIECTLRIESTEKIG